MKMDNTEITPTEEQEQFIESATKEIHQRIGSMRRDIFEIGRIITEVKKKIRKGPYSDWITRDLGISKTTARNYMYVYRECMGFPELVDSFKPSILYDVVKPSFPEELRKELLENTTGVHDYSRKDFLKVVTRYKKGEIEIDGDEVQGLLRKQRNQNVSLRFVNLLKVIEKDVQKGLKLMSNLNNSDLNNPLIEDKNNLKDREIHLKIEEFIENIAEEISVKITVLETTA